MQHKLINQKKRPRVIMETCSAFFARQDFPVKAALPKSSSIAEKGAEAFERCTL